MPWLRHLLPALAVLLAVGAVVLLGGPGAIGHPTGDMPDHLWGTWWVDQHLVSGSWPLHTDWTHYPEQLPLWHIDPVGAALAFPLAWLGPVGAFNAMVALQLLLSGLAAAATAGWLTQDRVAAAFAGVALVTHPFLLGALHSGLTELLGLWAPFGVAWVLLGRRVLDRRGGVLLGLLLGLCALQSAYYAVFGALLAACCLPGTGWRERLVPLGLAAGVSALVTLPWLLPLRRTLESGAVTAENAPGWGGVLPAVDLLTFVTPGAYYFPDTVANGNPGILQVNYLGWTLLVLGALGWLRRGALRRWALPAAGFALLLAGPRLTVMGWTSPLVLPLGWLMFPGSPLTEVHHPYRMVAFALPLLVWSAAMGFATLSGPGRALAVLLGLFEALVLSPAAFPIAHTDTTPPAATVPDGPRLDWPADASRQNRRYLLWQVHHHQPIPYGVNVFLPEDLRRDPLVGQLLRALDDPQAMARNRDVPFRGRVLLPLDPGESRLDELGYAAVVLHRDALTDAEATRASDLLTEALGPPDVHGATAVFTVGQ